MADTTITSANSVFTLTIPGLFNAPVQLEGFAADAAWNTNPVATAEVQVGVDGRMTAGFIPNPVVQTVHLQADSPSKYLFNQMYQTMQATKEIFYVSATIVLPSTGEAFVCTKGVLTNFKPLPDAGRVLQAMDFEITWQSILPSLI